MKIYPNDSKNSDLSAPKSRDSTIVEPRELSRSSDPNSWSRLGIVALPILLLMQGCYLNRAVDSPWDYAPSCPDTVWEPPEEAINHTPACLIEYPPENTPLSLGEIIDLALINNTQTRKTWAQARQAAAQYAQAQAPALPNISGSYYYNRSYEPNVIKGFNAPPFIQNSFLSIWGPSLTLSYTLFDFGQNKATSEAARQALYFADWTHNRAIETLIQTITSDYYNYLYQKALLKANFDDVATAKKTLDAAVLGLEMGVKDISDPLQAKTRFLQNEITLSSQKNNEQKAYANLLYDMGLMSPFDLEMDDLPEEMPPIEILKDVDSLVCEALEERADLLALEADLKSKEENLRAAKRAYYPNVQYQFEIGKTFVSNNLHDVYDFNGTITLNVPIFSGFSQRNAVRTARAQKEFSEASLQDKKIAITREITTAHYNVKIAFETLEYTKSFLASAENQYTVLLGKYQMGTTTIIDVISAQSSVSDARAQHVQALSSWYTALANLTYAIGILSNPIEKVCE